MRKILILVSLLVAACSPTEPTVLTTSVDVDQSALAALLSDIDAITENDLPITEMTQLAVSTPMDGEQQERFVMVIAGDDEEVLFHIWREQQDWLHLYFSSTSKDLVAAIEKSNVVYARNDTS